MDAVEFLRTFYRMCDSNKDCSSCEAFGVCQNECGKAEQMVEIVEKWAKDHPKKTRQSELQKIITGTRLNNEGVISLCPMLLTKNVTCKRGLPCADCQREYWEAALEEPTK